MPDDPLAYRLPTTVRPRRYDVALEVDPDRPTFAGVVDVAIDVAAPVRQITLHARDLDVREASLALGDHERPAKIQPDAAREVVVLDFAAPVPPGEAVLRLRYEGRVSRSMEGLYLSEEGDERCLATQCEETDARAIYPCFDEPAFKARLAWRVTAPAGATVLANGPLVSVEEATDGRRTWRFAATPPMSTYLSALVVGPLASTDVVESRGVPMRVWALHGRERLGGFSNGVAARLLPWFEDYFGKPYHFAKYDQVAVPSFSAGAMENSGLVIFRKSLLLHEARTTSWRSEKRIVLVVSHEMAHMWFGNLVTMRWWDDIWLNESFAEWIAHKAVDETFPGYRVWDDFQGGRAAALSEDALATTHPIYNEVRTPAQATEMFDTITYNKGSSVLRMLEAFLGEPTFRAGLRTYMDEFAQANAAGADLWRHLGRASGEPVADIMASWLLQPGHPVARMRLHDDEIHVAQRRFFLRPGLRGQETWRLPLVLRYEDDAGVHEARHRVDGREARLRLPVEGRIRWLCGNGDGLGFYRVDLDDGLLGRLLDHVDRLTPAEQGDLLEDEWALARADAHGLARFLRVLERLLERATHHSVLDRLVARLHAIDDLLAETGDGEALGRFRAAVAARLWPRMDALGWTPRAGEPREDAQARAALVRGLGGVARASEARAWAEATATREAADPAGVEADLAGPAVALAARFGDGARLERHLALYEARRASAAAPEAAARYLNSLAAFEDPALVARVLDYLGSGRAPLEALGPLMRAMLQERHAREQAWEFLRREWTTVRTRLGDMWTGFLVEATGSLPEGRRGEMVAFFDENLRGVAQQSYRRALEALDARAEFAARAREPLLAWARAL